MKNPVITSEKFLEALKSKGIKKDDAGWNPKTRKIGYAKTSLASKSSYSISFYYFDISEDNVIIRCPRGFSDLRGYKISDFENLISLLNN